MLLQISSFHCELEDRWHGVEIRTTKEKVRLMSVLHSKAQQDQPWHGMVMKKPKNSLRQNNMSYHKALQGVNRHGYDNARREREGHHGYRKARQEEVDMYQRAQREREGHHGYRKARREREGHHGYRKARQEQVDRHMYQRAQQEREGHHGYCKARREEVDRHMYRTVQGEREDHHVYHKARREEVEWHMYHKAQREGDDRHLHHKARREKVDKHGFHRAWREKDNPHGYKDRREKDDPYGFKKKKRKATSKPMIAFHQKAQSEEKECRSLENKKLKNTSWTINGLCHKARYEKNMLQSTYKQETPQDEVVALVTLLKTCANNKDLHRGSMVHTDIITRGLLENNVFIGSALVNMYAKCGVIEKAQEVFDNLPVHNVVSWTTLIAGYAQNGLVEEALSHFELMQCKGFSPDAFTFACVLKACTSAKAFDKGKAIHSLIVREYPLMEENTHVGTMLVDMYSKCGALEKAQEAFDRLPVQDLVSWTALIAGYAQHKQGEEALINFEQMQHEGFFPDVFTFACILKACGSTKAVRKGQSIHAQIVRHGLLENNMFIGTALVDMYASCGMLAEAQDSFNNLQVRDVVSWSALIEGYARHGHGYKALTCFEQMQHDGFTPDVVTLTCILKVCGSMGASKKCQEIYGHIVREQMLDTHIGTVLVDMYAKCGALEKAEEVFSKLQVRDVVLWTALIAGYTLNGHEEEALGSFEQMQSEGFYPDAITFTSILKACGNLGAVHKGQKLHTEIVRHGLLKNGMNVGSALIDMYANLGMLAEAQAVFDKLAVQDLVSWSVLIAGYAQLGKDKFVFSLFDKMIQEGKQPDPVTFISVLNTCSHKGLVDKGQYYFELLSKDFGMLPILEHHTCIIDLFGRAGLLDSAVAVIEDMSLSANLTLWHTFLGACRKWGNTKLGIWAFKHALQMSEINAAPYVAMRNIYSNAVHMDIEGNVDNQKSKQTWTYLGV